MQTFIYILIGVVVGSFGFNIFKNTKTEGCDDNHESLELNEKDQKILSLIEEKERVANNDIQVLLGVADSTATKYLQRLEDKGQIKQNGDAGRFVYYEKV